MHQATNPSNKSQAPILKHPFPGTEHQIPGSKQGTGNKEPRIESGAGTGTKISFFGNWYSEFDASSAILVLNMRIFLEYKTLVQISILIDSGIFELYNASAQA